MPLNPNILLGAQPMQIQQAQPVNQLNQLAQVMQMRNADMQFKEAERANTESTTLNELYKGAVNPDGTVNRNALLQGAAQRGLGSRIPTLQKGFAEQDKAKFDADKVQLETAGKRIDLWGQSMGHLRQNPTPQNAISTVQFLVTSGAMQPEHAQSIVAQIQADPSPQNIQQFADLSFRAALSAKDQLPTYQTRNLGGTTDTLAIDPVTQKVQTVNSAQNTQSPDNRASVGAQYAIAQSNRDAATINAKGARDAAAIKDNRDTEMKLADDWRNQSKNFREVSDAYKQINATLDKATTSPAATLAGATKFMKLIDPGSVVRESELGMALAASGVFDRASNYLNILQNGKVLTAKQASDFKDIAGQIYKAAQQTQTGVDQNYRRQAEQYKLRPEMIIQDLGQNVPPPAAPAAADSGAAALPPGWSVKAH